VKQFDDADIEVFFERVFARDWMFPMTPFNDGHSSAIDSDADRLDDPPPLLDLGLIERRKRLRSLLVATT
jgi:hypothetical protein